MTCCGIVAQEMRKRRPCWEEADIDAFAVGMLHGMKISGNAEEHKDDDGNSIWKATPKFLAETGLEPGSPVVFAPDVH